MAQYDEYGNWQEDEQPPQQQPVQPVAPITAPTPQTAAPAANPYNYEGFRTGWLTAGFGGTTSRDELAQHAAKWGVTLKNEKAYDPSGNFIADMIGDVDGKNTRIFLRGTGGKKPAPKGKPLPKGKAPKVVVSHGPGSGAPPTAPGGPAAPPAPPTAPPAPPPADPGGSVAPVQDPRLTALYEQLLARSKQGLAVDRNDPAVRSQADAYSAQEERARRNYLSDLAEDAGPNANLRGETRMSAEKMGQNVGNMEAQLVGRELGARREEIQSALTQMQGLLTTEQTLALQKELAMLDDATKRLDIGNRNSQFYADLGFRGKQLSEQARQFNNDLQFRNKALAEESRREAGRLGYQYDSLDWVRNPANPANRL